MFSMHFMWYNFLLIFIEYSRGKMTYARDRRYTYIITTKLHHMVPAKWIYSHDMPQHVTLHDIYIKWNLVLLELLPHSNPFVCLEDLIISHAYNQCTSHRFNDANFIIGCRWHFCPDMCSCWCEGTTRSEVEQHDLVWLHCCNKSRCFYFFQFNPIFAGLHTFLYNNSRCLYQSRSRTNPNRARSRINPLPGFRTSKGVD